MSATPETTAVPSAQHVAGFLYAGIWVVFLAVPLIAAWFSTADTLWRIVAVGATLVFGAVYLWWAWRFFYQGDQCQEPRNTQLVAACGALAVIAAVSIPGIGPWAGAFTTYIAALVIFTRAPLIGIPIGLLIWALPTVTAYVLAADQVIWIIAGPGFGMLFVIIFRITEYYEERDRQQAESLRAAEEQDRIARDVHDVLGHSLTVLNVKAQVARRMMETDPARARAELADIEQLAREGLGQVRATVTQLRAPQLPEEISVARTALQAAEIEAEVSVGENLPEEPGSILAWALREAVTNMVRHSGASRCRISLSAERLVVADDGVGWGEPAEGNGLRGLRERAARQGARFSIGGAWPELQGTTPERPGAQLEVTLR